MSRRLNVLFLKHPIQALEHPWADDVVRAIGDRHHLSIYDSDRPLADQFNAIDVVIDQGGSVGTRDMADAAAGKIRLWQILGQGFDHFDLAYWREKQISVANCPGHLSGVSLAETAMMFILMLARQYQTARANLDTGVLLVPVGTGLEDLKLGIIGFGASGSALAVRARSFGMRVSVIDVRDVGQDEIRQYGLESASGPDDMDRVLADSEFVSVHLNDETRHIIDDRRLRLMRPTAFLINVARGALVDEEALRKALVEGRLGGAGLDVYAQAPPDISHPVFRMSNVVATPHIAGCTDVASRKRAQAAAKNVDRIAVGLEPLFRIG